MAEEVLAEIERVIDRWAAKYEEDDENGEAINPFYMIEDLRAVLRGVG